MWTRVGRTDTGRTAVGRAGSFSPEEPRSGFMNNNNNKGKKIIIVSLYIFEKSKEQDVAKLLRMTSWQDTDGRRESSAIFQDPSYSFGFCDDCHPSSGSFETRSDEPHSMNHARNKSFWTVNNAFACCFLFFFAILGGALISISAFSATHTSRIGFFAVEQTQSLLSKSVNTSSVQLFGAASATVNDLLNSALLQHYSLLEQQIINFVGRCTLSVVQLAHLLEDGEINDENMDTTLGWLWILLLQYPTISFVNFGSAKTGDFIGIQRYSDKV